jgi:predicted nucleic-acid-binding protein
MIGLGTNVLVRYLAKDDPLQSPQALRLISERCTEDEPGFINVIVLCELVWVLESRFRFSRQIVAEVLDKLLRGAEFEIEDVNAAAAALRAYRQGKIDFADALIGRRNRGRGCTGTATFDRAAATTDDFFAV